MNLVTHVASGARNLFRFNGRLAIARRSGLKSALLAASLAFTSLARAQNTPHLGYVYPAGGQQGTTFQATVGGQFLMNVTNAFVSGAGGQAKGIE